VPKTSPHRPGRIVGVWRPICGRGGLLKELWCLDDGTNTNTGTQTPVTMGDDVLLPLLTELMDVCRVNHFPQGNDLRATLFKNLVGMAHGLGKKRFKRHYLELVTELLFATLEVEHGRHSSSFRTDDARDGNQLAVHAAEQCCEELSVLVGSMIFRGRLDDGQQEMYDSVLQK